MTDSTDEKKTVEEPRSESWRIVVGEDEAIIRMDLVEMLKAAGHDVVADVADGAAAVEAAREHQPDVVLLDVKMPKLDGISAAEQLAADRVAPVVLLTAFSDKTLVERAADVGVMGYVVKPFSESDVLPALEVARARWAQHQTLIDEVSDLTERFETRKRLDRAKGLLMEKLDLSETDAFRWIQKAAMDRRMSMREVADAVITSMGSDSKGGETKGGAGA